MAKYTYVPDQGSIYDIKGVRLEWYQGINNFFTRGAYLDLYNRSIATPTQADTANATIPEGSYNVIVTNTGATTDITIRLPIATKGLEFKFRVVASHFITVRPSTTGSDIIEGGTHTNGIQSNTPFAYLHLICVVSGVWDIIINKLTWTIV